MFTKMSEGTREEWDQTAFDPEYDTEPLENFIPLIEKFFGFPKAI